MSPSDNSPGYQFVRNRRVPVTALPPGFELRITSDYEAGSALAAGFLASALKEKPDLLFSAATGNSPERAYQLFVQSVLADGLSVAGLRILKLDEWGGLPMKDPATCETQLQALLIQPLKVSAERFISFHSDPSSPEEECRRVGAWLQDHGPVDFCVLGLGINGHLGLNEPADELIADCHVAPLTKETLSHPMLSATRHQPRHGLTLGMRDILSSGSILLLVFGAAKATQLETLLTCGLSTHFPASFLALHQRVVCICDESASAQLPQEIVRRAIV